MDLSVCLKALGDPTRFTIFRQLLIRRHCTKSLAGKLGITEAAVSQHLRILREAGLVYRVRYGYHTHYLPSREAMDFLAQSFEEMRTAAVTVNDRPALCQCAMEEEARVPGLVRPIEKEPGVTRIAVPWDDGRVFSFFGRADRFRLYDAREGTVLSARLIDTCGIGHGALAALLARVGTDVLICGHVGAGARDALKGAGIRFYAGCEGNADEAVGALLAGTLASADSPDCAPLNPPPEDASAGGPGPEETSP